MEDNLSAVIENLSIRIHKALPKGFENKYYSKMDYSGINKVLTYDSELLRKTISKEIGFAHFIVYQLASCLKYDDYLDFFNKLDEEHFFDWYTIDENIKNEFYNLSYNDADSLYILLQEHDKLIDKSIRKELGQFYTPIEIVEQIIGDLKDSIKSLTNKDRIMDPAVGAGVLISEVVKSIKENNKSINILKFINENIYAYDVNPFAVFATKISLILKMISLVGKEKTFSFLNKNKSVLNNIKIENTITSNHSIKYSIIISNPPYFKLNSDMLKKVTDYNEIIYGQPNIYSLFMYWGLKHLESNGTMSYIIPQSIKSGRYFQSIRQELSKYVIKSITCVSSRQRIFDKAEQAVLILNVKNKKRTNDKTKIQFLNGSKEIDSFYYIHSKRIIMDADNNYLMVIHRSAENYEIVDKIYSNCYTLSENASNYKFSNGLFVWNQHKDLLSDNPSDIPIIYGGNIQPMMFIRNIEFPNKEKKRYAKCDNSISSFIKSGVKLVIQRTTNYDKNTRIKACILPNEFVGNNSEYLLENHVNYLASKNNDTIDDNILYYFLGVLNSSLFNRIFVSFSGNTQVSASELNLMPLPYDPENLIANYMKEIDKKDSFNQNKLDLIVGKLYGLTSQELNQLINDC